MIPTEYPRPHMYRKSWRSLNGMWEFDFYDDNFVYSHEEKIAGPLNQTIRVPFTYQAILSGIGTGDIHERVIYRKRIQFTDNERSSCVRLHFSAVDFKAEIWIDNAMVGSHAGGYTPFYFDISPFIEEKREMVLSVIVEDKPSPEQPRGKQAMGTPFACWYTAATGIWQSVWLEFLPEIYIDSFSLVPHSNNGTLHCRLRLSEPCNGFDDCRIEAEVRLGRASVASLTGECSFPNTEMSLTVPELRRWSPEEPNLYSVIFSLMNNDEVIDQIETYAAFRTIELKSDGLYVNKRRYFQKLVLMQGFWQKGGYTAPDTESFEKDINRAKEMGFNGCRMHMKFEDPGFLYAADRIGFLVWGEAPSFYSFTEVACAVFRKELTNVMLRDLIHPSLIAWVIGNESWGMRDIRESEKIRSWLKETVEMTRAIDSSRPIISNDGWEHLGSDIMTFHSYEHSEASLRDDWDRARRNERCGIHGRVFNLEKKSMEKLPWVLSEFGAVSYIGKNDRLDHWGYGDALESKKALLERFASLMELASSLDGITGWCYTQFSDTEKEKNGLLFADRTPKVEPSQIKNILERG